MKTLDTKTLEYVAGGAAAPSYEIVTVLPRTASSQLIPLIRQGVLPSNFLQIKRSYVAIVR